MKIGSRRLVPKINQQTAELDNSLQKPKINQNLSQERAHLSQAWQVNGQKILHNGQDLSETIAKLVKENPTALTKLASELEKYRDSLIQEQKSKWWKKLTGSKTYDQRIAICQAYLKMMEDHIKEAFQHQQTGVKIDLDEWGQLTLNGLNLNQLLEEYENDSPHDARLRLFVKGARNRLMYIIGHSDHKVFQRESLKEAAENLCKKMNEALGDEYQTL
jgi:hypothetical protein